VAASPSHRFGQIIGDVLEAAVAPLLSDFAAKHGLYLDRRGERPARPGKKCSWVDSSGNKHDLDFVLERGGTSHSLGTPAAFIEIAWRRYTKHSRNKAQEIQGAIIPLAETFRHVGPFKGAILAGVFTDGALTQLRSLGFTVAYFSYESVVNAFSSFGIEARYDETTPDREFAAKVEAFEGLPKSRRDALAAALLRANEADMKHFMAALTVVVLRRVERVVILVLYGTTQVVASVAEAIAFVKSHERPRHDVPIERYEIQIRYDNGNVIEGRFKDQDSAVAFLETYQA
jgi:hypothetical protein